MERQPVSSTNIRSVGWNATVLEVEFESGRIYQYFNVPESVYNGLMESCSPAGFFNSDIKDSYQFIRIS